jgi:hypothetical protein
MTPAVIAQELFDDYGAFRLDHLTPASCVHHILVNELQSLSRARGEPFSLSRIGESIEGRSINLILAGTGPRRVLLWSQMHGDEPTATLALLDILHLFTMRDHPTWVDTLLQELTLCMIPLVNPDGAERRERRNAVGIDINRDARMAATPEARTLLRAHQDLQPEFGFNLHDQDLNSAGSAPAVAALALLAPPADPERTITRARLKAMRIGALISRVLDRFAGGHITRYDDTFEPRGFGDLFQGAGTGTLLIESGDWPGDPDKNFIRKLNAVAILTALHSIARCSYEDEDVEHYLTLPPNGKQVFDVLIRGLLLQHPGGWTSGTDLGLLRQRGTTLLTVKDVGDLHSHGGLETSEVNNRVLPPALARIGTTIEKSALFELLQIPC